METKQKNIKNELKKTLFILIGILVVLTVLYLINSKTDFLLKLTESLIK